MLSIKKHIPLNLTILFKYVLIYSILRKIYLKYLSSKLEFMIFYVQKYINKDLFVKTNYQLYIMTKKFFK